MQVSTGKTAGVALCVAALRSVLAMSHHPTSAHAGPIGPVVHGGMIVWLSLMAWGFANFALIRGVERPLVSAGLLALGISLAGHIAAGTINGFVVPALAANGPPISHDVLRFAWHSNQAFAKLGMIAGALAFILWSIELLGDRAKATKVVGAAGLAVGALMIALPAAGALMLNVAGAWTLYALQALWALLVGVQMIRGKLQLSGKVATAS